MGSHTGVKSEKIEDKKKTQRSKRLENTETDSAEAFGLFEQSISVRAKPTASASPWQNGFAERLIGSIRRECADHIIVFGEAHLRRILRSYACYYNGIRTHRSLDKDAPISRPVQRTGVINSRAILGGLHHHYARV
jgi:transposase InsO family protein